LISVHESGGQNELEKKQERETSGGRRFFTLSVPGCSSLDWVDHDALRRIVDPRDKRGGPKDNRRLGEA